MLKKRLLPFVLCTCFASASIPSTASTASTPFQSGDRWTAVGDSITHGGQYYVWVYLYQVTRFPELTVEVSNSGISGSDAHGALKRYDWDIQPQQPTVASIMLGMNDVRREIYGDMPETPQLLDQRLYILEGYRSFMTKLVKRLQQDGSRIFLITPSIYDETAKHATEVLTGVNDALGACAAFAAELAKETNATLVDLHGPMTEINAQIQAKDPAASLIKTDRVHPTPPGNFVMAYLFLKSVEAEGTVTSIHIDAPTAKVIEVTNATVEDFSAGKDTINFTLKANAIPFPVGKAQAPALEWVPFQEEFNREILQVTGLTSGEYQLSIDGQVIRSFRSEELAQGVNLALETNTPQAMQSAKVLDLMEAWHQQVLEQRSIASFEYWKLGDLPHPVSIQDAQQHFEAMAEVEPLSSSTIKEDKWFLRYLKIKPNEQAIAVKLNEMSSNIRSTAQPQAHAYNLKAAN